MKLDLRPLNELKAHPRHAQGVTFSPDGGEIATTGMDALAKVWSVPDLEPLRMFEGHEKSVNAISISPDGSTAITASSDRAAIVWSYESAEPLHTLTGFRNTLASARFSPDGSFAAVSSYDGRVGIWERESEQFRVFRSHPRHVTSLSFSADGETLAASGIGGVVKIWDVESRELVSEMEAEGSAAVGSVFLPDGDLFCHTYEGRLLRFPPGASEPSASAQMPDGALNSVAPTPGRSLLVCSVAGGVRLLDSDTFEVVASAQTRIKGMYGVCSSPDGSLAAAVSADGRCRLWSIED